MSGENPLEERLNELSYGINCIEVAIGLYNNNSEVQEALIKTYDELRSERHQILQRLIKMR